MKQEWIVLVWDPFNAKEILMRDAKHSWYNTTRMVHPNINVQMFGIPCQRITQKDWTTHLKEMGLVP